MSLDDLADRAEISDVIARYAMATDLGSIDEYTQCLAPDVEVVIGATIHRGHASVVESLLAARASGLMGPGSGALHHVAASVIDVVDGVTATSVTPWIFTTPGDPPGVRSGWYRDRLSRTALGWRIARREIVAANPSPAS